MSGWIPASQENSIFYLLSKYLPKKLRSGVWRTNVCCPHHHLTYLVTWFWSQEFNSHVCWLILLIPRSISWIAVVSVLVLQNNRMLWEIIIINIMMDNWCNEHNEGNHNLWAHIPKWWFLLSNSIMSGWIVGYLHKKILSSICFPNIYQRNWCLVWCHTWQHSCISKYFEGIFLTI